MCALEQALADLKAAETVHAAVRPRKGKHDQHGALRRAGERDRIADAAGVALRADVRQQRRKGGEIRGVELQPPLAVRHDAGRLARLRIAAVEQQRLAVCREEIPLEIDARPAVRVAALLRGVQQDERAKTTSGEKQAAFFARLQAVFRAEMLKNTKAVTENTLTAVRRQFIL